VIKLVAVGEEDTLPAADHVADGGVVQDDLAVGRALVPTTYNDNVVATLSTPAVIIAV
jgi:hypothetical protein